MCCCTTLWNISVQKLPCSTPEWSTLSCNTQPLKKVVENFLTMILAFLFHWLEDIPSSHIKIPTVWLYASAATQKKRHCSKMLLYMIRGRLVTSCLWLPQMFTYFKNCFTRKLNNKSIVKWVLNSPPHLKHVATLPCDLLLITMHASDFRLFSNIDLLLYCGTVPQCITFQWRQRHIIGHGTLITNNFAGPGTATGMVCVGLDNNFWTKWQTHLDIGKMVQH